MLRFINLKGQLTEGNSDFAWYDTVTDKFLEFNGIQVWDRWEEFLADFAVDCNFHSSIDRFSALFPVAE